MLGWKIEASENSNIYLLIKLYFSNKLMFIPFFSNWNMHYFVTVDFLDEQMFYYNQQQPMRQH